MGDFAKCDGATPARHHFALQIAIEVIEDAAARDWVLFFTDRVRISRFVRLVQWSRKAVADVTKYGGIEGNALLVEISILEANVNVGSKVIGDHGSRRISFDFGQILGKPTLLPVNQAILNRKAFFLERKLITSARFK